METSELPGFSVDDATREGDEEGMVWATLRKKSSIYWREPGSYYLKLSEDII